MFASMGLHFEQYYSKNQEKKIKEFDELIEKGRGIAKEIVYFFDNILWLTERFHEGKYVNVVIEDDGMTEEKFNTKAEISALKILAKTKNPLESRDFCCINLRLIYGDS